MKTIREIQIRLIELDYYSGHPDGIRGPKTEQAIIDFKRDNGLRARPFVGPITLSALFPNEDMSTETTPEWLQVAESYKGLKEIPGSGNNPTILDWADDLDISYPGDDIPWCGLFVGHCVASVVPEEPLPDNILGARKWSNYGKQCDPVIGSILVFWRGSPSGWQGHVGFYYAEDSTAYHVLGGNQSNGVNVARISKDRLLTARWPSTRNVFTKPYIINNNGTVLSTNEQ